jgi:predicted DNA-binding transcriptional regulator AlpA
VKCSTEAARLKSILSAQPKPCMVLVSAAYAKQFKPAPKDGHTYVVQDPDRLWVHHMLRADGKHVILDKKQPPHCPGYSGKVSVHVKDLSGKAKKKAPRYSTLLTVGVPIERESNDPPAIRLIGIERVIAIVGFQKSFIYSQPDFPEAVRWGQSRRSAVRWVESEVLTWCEKHMARRSTTAMPVADQSPR